MSRVPGCGWEWQSLGKQITNAGEDVDKRNSSTLLVDINLLREDGNEYGTSSKPVKTDLPRDPAVLLLCVYWIDPQLNISQRDLHIRIYDHTIHYCKVLEPT